MYEITLRLRTRGPIEIDVDMRPNVSSSVTGRLSDIYPLIAVVRRCFVNEYISTKGFEVQVENGVPTCDDQKVERSIRCLVRRRRVLQCFIQPNEKSRLSLSQRMVYMLMNHPQYFVPINE